jgi:hypothetical protein
MRKSLSIRGWLGGWGGHLRNLFFLMTMGRFVDVAFRVRVGRFLRCPTFACSPIDEP